MKGKRFYLIIGILIATVIVFACLKNTDAFKTLAREGVQAYELSEKEKELLSSFGMEGNSHIISFNAPKELTSLELKAYKLKDNKEWEVISSGGISIARDRQPIDRLFGSLTMQLLEDHVIQCNINTAGRASFKTDKIILDGEEMASLKVFLQDYQEIERDREIPLALMVYDGKTSMRNYSLEDYFNPTKFQGVDLVQVLTLTFKAE